jgi:glycosyltransferase involved in cell wall biosynthesis
MSLPAPFVSFLIPAYNVAPFIGETLASVLSADRNDFEIIVVNDGSTDETPAILATIDDARVRVIHQQNRGLPATRNTGILNSRGDVLIFLDGDDLFDMSALDSMVQSLLADPEAVLAYGNNVKFHSDGRRWAPSPYGRIRRRPSGHLLREIVQRNFIGPPGCCCVRRRAVDQAGMFDATLLMGEDWEFYCRMASVGSFVFVPVVCLHYRQHDTSMSKAIGLKSESYARFTERLFASEFMATRFDAAERAQLRRSHQSHIHGFIAIRALEARAYRKSLAALALAIRTYPPRTVEFLARYGWIALQSLLVSKPKPLPN